MLSKRTKIIIAIIIVATLFLYGFCLDEYYYWDRHLRIAKNLNPSMFDILTWGDGWKWYLANRLDQGVMLGIAHSISSVILVPMAWYAWEDISHSSHKVETAFELLFKAFCFILVSAVGCAIAYAIAFIISSALG